MRQRTNMASRLLQALIRRGSPGVVEAEVIVTIALLEEKILQQSKSQSNFFVKVAAAMSNRDMTRLTRQYSCCVAATVTKDSLMVSADLLFSRSISRIFALEI